MSPIDNLVESEFERFSAPAAEALYQVQADRSVTCKACAHQCSIRPGKRGICRMRKNVDGVLYVPNGYVVGLHADPIEKKPFFHVLPGSFALSFGMSGCNFSCDFCQNWQQSQVLRDPNSIASFLPILPEKLVRLALNNDAPVVVSTYNEPLITADWAAKIFGEAVKHSLICGFVSNGFATPEVLKFLRPVMRLLKVDLKCFSESGYQHLGGRLKPVQDSIALALELQYWVEVVTLIVPDFNDSEAELKQLANFLYTLSPDIPWHVTAFYPTYKRKRGGRTTMADLERAWQAGKEAGLRYVYMGNVAGQAGNRENTFCHGCKTLLIERCGFQVHQNILKNGTCPTCKLPIPGIWNRAIIS